MDKAATPAQWRELSEQFQAAALQATPGIPLISTREARPWWPIGGGLSGQETQANTKPLPEPADPPICPL